jgi:ech hydrogenase subunit D
MKPNQTLEIIPLAALLERVGAERKRGARLVQICATALPGQFELTYSFDIADGLTSLRVHLPDSDPRVPSITPIYACAFLYENEMHDLFKIKVEGINVDFQGKLYNTTVKYAFGDTKPPAAKPPPAAATTPKAAAPVAAAAPVTAATPVTAAAPVTAAMPPN